MTELVPVAGGSLSHFSPEQRATSIAAAFLAGYTGRTREAYAGDLRDFGAWCAGHELQVLDVARAHITVYARSLEEAGRSPATVARRLSTLAGFYKYAVVEGFLDRSPADHVRRPRVSDESPRLGLDRVELGLLLGAAAASSPRDHALVCLLALNGLRVSEACAAAAEDLDDERGHRVLRVVGKGGKKATVPLAPRTAAAVDEQLAGRDAGPLLGIDRRSADRIVRRLARAAGITKTISPHSLRHSFCTLALDAGVALHHVQDAMRHADPRTTRRYDRARDQLDKHATYAVSSYVA
ncbi:MAG: tyrosine-type recombinase/integrase [Frankia sp.]|nr:tyrosine-type recombinase/integrase [Frankia sp.]